MSRRALVLWSIGQPHLVPGIFQNRAHKLSPEGTIDNSPAFQRRVYGQTSPSPEGMVEILSLTPPFREVLATCGHEPTLSRVCHFSFVPFVSFCATFFYFVIRSTRANSLSRFTHHSSLITLLLLALTACNTKLPPGALVLTQTPLNTTSSLTDILDQRYPPGSRVVLSLPGSKPDQVRVLSKGLLSAGAPVVCPSGDCIYFAGKAAANSSWQIYSVKSSGGQPKAVTSIQGGAMDPAIISTGEIVFSSPATMGQTEHSRPAALYVQALGGTSRRLTFGPTPAFEPTVLRDGRILFVSRRPVKDPTKPADWSLFTVNNDGTEVTVFALDHDGPRIVHRPRELLDGRVGFVSTDLENVYKDTAPEAVRTARPFLTRAPVFPFPTSHCRSVESDGTGALLACLETRGMMGRSMTGSYAVYRLTPDAKGPGEPIFQDPSWNTVEAVPLAAHPNPMGHVTAIMPAKKYGTILCLNANFTRQTNFSLAPSDGERAGVRGPANPVKVRIFTRDKAQDTIIGEVPLQSDGSFMAQVPAQIPLGFETLDDQGSTLQRAEPFLWLHPGENRSCLGCHEPYNHTLRNIRPLAASLAPVVLTKEGS